MLASLLSWIEKRGIPYPLLMHKGLILDGRPPPRRDKERKTEARTESFIECVMGKRTEDRNKVKTLAGNLEAT